MDASQSEAAIPSAAQPTSATPKQAILVIHGMGEQKPMDTIRDFVRAAWQTDNAIHNRETKFPKPDEVWSKPDGRTGSLELRRITTPPSIGTDVFKAGVRSDFYELYWADLSGGSTWSEVKDWIAGLLLRNPFTRVPRGVFLAWVLLWFAALMVIVLAIATVLPYDATIGPVRLWDLPGLQWLYGVQAWKLAFASALLAVVIHRFVVPYFGRVVRYTRAEPENIAARKNIRERGLELLRQLHKAEYERIIIVGHSLGSILAYDLVSYYWAQHPETHTVGPHDQVELEALGAVEKAVAALEQATAALEKEPIDPNKESCDAAANDFRDAQTRFCRSLRERTQPETRWLITDLVTLGSPLTHAEFLLANNAKDLDERKKGREFPTCPPLREQLDPKFVDDAQTAGLLPPGSLPVEQQKLLSFQLYPGALRPHHAAPFAAVRWTNIYDPAVVVFCGDIISGALASAFGRGMLDVNLRAERGQSWIFTHTRYWWTPKRKESESETAPHSVEPGSVPVHLRALRTALDLARLDRDW